MNLKSILSGVFLVETKSLKYQVKQTQKFIPFMLILMESMVLLFHVFNRDNEDIEILGNRFEFL